jgi:RNA polymerase sigma-70 factor (ECF subfamily)
VVARVCLNTLRTRQSRREEPFEVHLPDPVVTEEEDPEHEALLADAVGLALLVVLESLAPAERVAFVLHDMFAFSFEEIADMLDRTPAATRQLASRARRKLHGVPTPDPDIPRQRRAVNAFFAAAREGDLPALLAVLDPDVVLTADAGKRKHQTMVLRGAAEVSAEAAKYRALDPMLHPVLINGTAGVAVRTGDRTLSVMAFTVTNDRITAIDVLSDQDRLAALGI